MKKELKVLRIESSDGEGRQLDITNQYPEKVPVGINRVAAGRFYPVSGDYAYERHYVYEVDVRGQYHIIEEVKTTLQPEGRAIATAASFELFFKNAPSLTESALQKALVFLSYKKDSDTPAIQARRATCAEIAEIANRDDSPVIAVAQKAWGEWVAYLIEQVENVPDEQKPRYGAMLATAQRELAELSEW